MTTPQATRHRPRRLRVLITILIAIAFLICAGVGFSKWSHRPQGIAEATEFADAALSEDLTQARVLALGEATHGNAEFQQLRLQLLQKLPEFRAIAIEEDYGAVQLVDEYLQGGPGTAQEAVRKFGFTINYTEQMAELLQWIHDHNTGLAAEERIHMVGIDMQRVDANKQIALDWLDQNDPAIAATQQDLLADWTDDRAAESGELDALNAAVDDLIAAIEAAPDGGGRQIALNAATTLHQHLEVDAAADYSATRAQLMADNLSRTVAEQQSRGNEHTLLFAHNGHVDKSSAGFGHDDLGALAAAEFGDDYRVIGTEVHHSRLISGDGADRWEVTLNNPTPLRGMFAGTTIGYLDFATASPDNQVILAKPVRMASAGERFRQWQAWIPWFNSVEMVPLDSYDALIFLDRAGPVTPL